MARQTHQTRLYLYLISLHERQLLEAFIAGVADLYAGIVWAQFLEALERRDIEAAILGLNIEPAAFHDLETAMVAAFADAGSSTTGSINIPGRGKIAIRFHMADLGAESWIKRNVGEKIVGIANEQISNARVAVAEGFSKGLHPTTIARDVAGRVVNGKRQGGIIGLDGPRAERLRIVTQGMRTTEGVKDLVVVGRDGTPRVRYAVNKATEARILRAWRAGEAVAAGDQAISTRQYQNALLKARADMIARTETLQAVMGGKREAWQQTMDRQDIPATAIIKRWSHGGGVKDPRPHHVAMNGHMVRGIDTPFEFSNGATLRFAGDPNGASSEVIACSCGTEIFVDPQWSAEHG